MSKITFVTNVEINPVKWDRCISSSFNGILYAYSWYLNIVSDDWCALVLDDYKAVMPLPAKRKFGINYLFQPFFTQQLGVFSTEKLNSELVERFCLAIPKKYWFIEMNLNIFNKLNPIPSFHQDEYPTYQLDLINSYELIHKSYSSNTKRNIKKANAQKVKILTAVTINEFIKFAKENLSPKVENLTEANFASLRMLIATLVKYKAGEIYGAFSAKNELCAVAFFASAQSTSIYLMGTSNALGFENKAMFLLIDHFIQKNSEHNTTLDFEGSQIEGIARFYRGFGASQSKFPVLKKNKFPFLLAAARKIKTCKKKIFNNH